jgi:hypothetical protein
MKIGIDISQLAYPETGVANYLQNLVQNLIQIDKKNEYILFFSSLRGKLRSENLKLKDNPNVQIKTFKIPPTLLDLIWNRLHILPIENLIGPVDVFVTSDWTEPPVKKAKKVTILYDLIVYKHPKETAEKIVNVQKRKLQWVKKESQRILCISEVTRKDAEEVLGVPQSRLAVIYPGF